jgi:hypothetical protein
MRLTLMAGVLLAACLGSSGCGGSSAADPASLPSLSAEERKQFDETQAQVRQEEKSGMLKPAKPGTSSRPKPASRLERF